MVSFYLFVYTCTDKRPNARSGIQTHHSLHGGESEGVESTGIVGAGSFFIVFLNPPNISPKNPSKLLINSWVIIDSTSNSCE